MMRTEANPAPLAGEVPTIRVGDRFVVVDGSGFLVEPLDWDEDVAMVLAEGDRIELEEDHWAVLQCIREYYLEFDVPPMVRLILRRTGLGMKRLDDLFLTRCRDCMCRIAGLPKPTG